MNRRSFVKSSIAIGASVAVPFISSRVYAQGAGGRSGLSGVPADVQALLDPSLEAELLLLSDLGADTYYVVSQFDNEGTGEPIFIRKSGNGEPVIIADTRGLPLELSLGINGFNSAIGGSNIDLDISGYGLDQRDIAVYVSGAARAPAPEIDSKLGIAAKDNLNLVSKDAPGTNHGRLACAWAVNRIVSRTLGRPIGGGLSTANMVQVLKARHAKVSEGSAPPGSIVISPTQYHSGRANVGHVGILGEGDAIYSNSSSRGRWEQNFTVNKWKSYYGGKGLMVLYFRLDGDYF